MKDLEEGDASTTGHLSLGRALGAVEKPAIEKKTSADVATSFI